ncbi:hypothetical protein GCM10023085_62890 [Actinomadura viridis]|uniref:CHAT domain-containing protein n=1 Tax=Actinomadura viridis TaxID=58110 RepID=A0A931GK87_9ACTN|nr:CHAT domain-containing protein [Actinomadura viridis]MBG6086136.1 CHAT domain-containing protein [Actinomadura viridis]
MAFFKRRRTTAETAGSVPAQGGPRRALDGQALLDAGVTVASVTRSQKAYHAGTRYLDQAGTPPDPALVEKAVAELRTAVEGYAPLIPFQPSLWADAMIALGTAYRRRRKGARRDHLECALDCYRNVLEVCQEDPGRGQRVAAMRQLGETYLDRLAGDRAENVEQAIEVFKEALRSLTPDSNAWPQVQHALGVAYNARKRGDPAVNIELALRHLAEAVDALDPRQNPHDWWVTHHALGAAYDYRVAGDRGGNLDRAVQHLQAALRTCDRRAYPDGWAMIQQSLGLVYGRRASAGSPEGNARQDLALARESLHNAMSVRTRSADPQGWARAMEALAMLEENAPAGHDTPSPSPPAPDPPRPDDAQAPRSPRELLAEALESLREEARPVGEAASPDVIERRITDLRAAAKVHDRDNDPVAWARSRILLAAALEQDAAVSGRGHWKERAKLLADVLTVHTIDSDPGLCAGVAEQLGLVMAAQHRWGEAADAFQLAWKAGEALYPAALTQLGRRNHLLERTGQVPRLGSYCLAKAGRLTEAVALLESGRARVLGDALGHDRRQLERLAGEHPRLHRLYRDAADRLHRIHNAGDIFTDVGDRLIQLAHRTQAAKRALDGVVRRIRDLDGYAAFQQPPGAETVRAAVRPDVPIAYLNTTPWGSLTLLVTADGPDGMTVRPQWIDGLTGDDLYDLLNRSASPDTVFPVMAGYLRLLYNIVETRFADGQASLSFGALWDEPDALLRTGREELPRLHLLGRTVLHPLARALADLGPSSVVLIPCGPLATMPLHAIPYTDDTDGRCLIDDLPVMFAPSSRVVSYARDRARQDWPTPSLAGVGNPLPHDSPLRFAARELQRIAALFDQATCLYGEDATPERLAEAARAATHVHLACHGAVPYTAAETPYLALAGGRRLTLEDLVRERPFPAARLAVLSACQSSLVGSHLTTDESLGLATAVMISGTPGVIGALWPVNDLSTALLMSRFYLYHLSGDPDGDGEPMQPWRALARAQRWLSALTAEELGTLLRSDPELLQAARENETRSPGAQRAMAAVRDAIPQEPDSRPFSDPYFWAPFVYIGQ